MLVKLGSLIKIKHGFAFKSENYVKNSKVALITLGNISENNTFKINENKLIFYDAEYPEEYNLIEGDLIIPLTEQAIGLFGNTAFIPKYKDYQFVLNQRVGKIIVDENKANKHFIHHLLALDYVKNQLEARASGTSQRNLSPEKIYDILVFVPSIETQNKIGNVLNDIEKQIERNNAMTKRLQVMAQTTYSRWFNQFEFPNNEGKPYKSDGGELVYNKELGKEIPKDCEVKHLTDIVKWESASQPPKEVFKYKYQDGYIRFIQNRDYENDNHITFIPLLKTTKLCNKTDIMMDKYGDAGSVRYGLEGAYNVALAKISPIIPNTQEYIRKYLEQNSTYNYLHNACIASTRASLNESLLQNLLIVLPNSEVLKSFEKQQKNILYQILKIKKNNQELVRLKEKLLPLLINGQLNI